MSLTFTSPTPTLDSVKSLEIAILETLAYSDIFDYPLTLDELHNYLVISASKEEIKNCLEKMNQVSFDEGYYFLSKHHVTLSRSPERSEGAGEGSLPQTSETHIVQTRMLREKKSQPLFKRALIYGNIIGKFPFVKMVALTGSLAMLNLSSEIDMDFMLITKPNRLWLARAFAVTFGRFIRLLGDRICINLLISENHLHWSQHDLYSAREISQMIPVSGFRIYIDFRVANLWVNQFLPNATLESASLLVDVQKQTFAFQKILEIPFLGKLGDWIENQVMNFQLKIIAKNFGNGEETKFTSDICQGNFHHHKKWTQIEYEKRIAFLLGER